MHLCDHKCPGAIRRRGISDHKGEYDILQHISFTFSSNIPACLLSFVTKRGIRLNRLLTAKNTECDIIKK